MKYTSEIEIDLPRDRVIALFDNPDNLSQWQEGLVSMETISGEPGEVGTKSKIIYDMNGRIVEMIETIVKKDLPERYDFIFEAKGVYNEIENHFEEMGPDKTKWTCHNLFECKGFLRIIAFIMPSSFKKQSFKYLENFKKFAESTED